MILLLSEVIPSLREEFAVNNCSSVQVLEGGPDDKKQEKCALNSTARVDQNKAAGFGEQKDGLLSLRWEVLD